MVRQSLDAQNTTCVCLLILKNLFINFFLISLFFCFTCSFFIEYVWLMSATYNNVITGNNHKIRKFFG